MSLVELIRVMRSPFLAKSEKYDFIELDLTTEEKEAEFSDEMNSIAIESTVDCYIKFNDPNSKPVLHRAVLIYNWFIPVKKVYTRSVSGSGKLYIWGEKLCLSFIQERS